MRRFGQDPPGELAQSFHRGSDQNTAMTAITGWQDEHGRLGGAASSSVSFVSNEIGSAPGSSNVKVNGAAAI